MCRSSGLYPLIPNKCGDSGERWSELRLLHGGVFAPPCAFAPGGSDVDTKGLERQCGPSERPRLLSQSQAPHLSPARVCIAVAGSLAVGISSLAWRLHHRLQSQSFDAFSFLAFSVSACRLLS